MPNRKGWKGGMRNSSIHLQAPVSPRGVPTKSALSAVPVDAVTSCPMRDVRDRSSERLPAAIRERIEASHPAVLIEIRDARPDPHFTG